MMSQQQQQQQQQTTTCELSGFTARVAPAPLEPSVVPVFASQPQLQDTSTTFDTNPAIFESLRELGLAQGNLADPGNLFAFDGVFDFPYTPNPIFPPAANTNQAPMLPPYLTADFDALLGPIIPLDMGNSANSANSVNPDPGIIFPSLNTCTESFAGIDNTCFSPWSGVQPGGNSGHSQNQDPFQQPVGSGTGNDQSPGMDVLSSIRTNSTFSNLGEDNFFGGAGQDRNGHRQTLLDTICSLVQLASSMQ
jgi:hypothetical protein